LSPSSLLVVVLVLVVVVLVAVVVALDVVIVVAVVVVLVDALLRVVTGVVLVDTNVVVGSAAPGVTSGAWTGIELHVERLAVPGANDLEQQRSRRRCDERTTRASSSGVSTPRESTRTRTSPLRRPARSAGLFGTTRLMSTPSPE
jgi:hypothetical protein